MKKRSKRGGHKKKGLDAGVFREFINTAVEMNAQARTKHILAKDPVLSPFADLIDETDPFSLRKSLVGISELGDPQLIQKANEVDDVFFKEVERQWTSRDDYIKNLEDAATLCSREFDERECDVMRRNIDQFVEEFDTFRSKRKVWKERDRKS